MGNQFIFKKLINLSEIEKSFTNLGVSFVFGEYFERQLQQGRTRAFQKTLFSQIRGDDLPCNCLTY